MSILLLATAITGLAAWAGEPVDEYSSYANERRDAVVDVKDDLDGPATEVRYLKQGWTPAQSMRFYRLPQGSRLIPYRWFVNLEQAGSQARFADPENMNRYRYLPLAKHPQHNPDGLPIGFVREPVQPDDALKTDWLGLTCAACHTAEIRHEKIAYRIDGGPALADHDTFLIDMTAAMKATLEDAARFERFATSVLGAGAVPAARQKLRNDFAAQFTLRQKYNERNRSTFRKGNDTLPLPYGFARLDAFGRIMNETLVRHIRVSDADQARSPNAPVSYPFLWGITRHDRVQWNGIANNTKIEVGPLGRNVGEVLGVFGEVDVPPLILGLFPALERGFRSSVRFGNLLRLEDTVDKLGSPRWEDVFGKLDATKVARGKELFEKHCLECHDPNPRVGNFIKTTLIPVDKAGTDPLMAKNFAERVGKVGNLKHRITTQKRQGLDIGLFKKDAPAGAILIGVVGRTILGADPVELAGRANLAQIAEDARQLKSLAIGSLNPRAIFERIDESRYLNMTGEAGEDLLKYRARPLEGIWATAPYLHNGSVPNLEELLLPSKRSKVFKVGSREFDPVNVGFRTDRGFEFDTSLPGNSNAGHDTYGVKDLTDDTQRAALLEYLKSL